MNFYRKNFYNLLIELLNSIEDSKYFLLVSWTKSIKVLDINNKMIIHSYKYTILNQDKKLVFEDNSKVEEYYDFTYYRTDSVYYDNDIISIEQIKSIILQNVVNYPYLIILYKLLLELGSKYEVVTLNNKEIIDLVKEYSIEESKLSNKVLKRKK